MTLLVIGITLILLSLLGTVAQAAGLVDDTVSAEISTPNIRYRIIP